VRLDKRPRYKLPQAFFKGLKYCQGLIDGKFILWNFNVGNNMGNLAPNVLVDVPLILKFFQRFENNVTNLFCTQKHILEED